MYAGPSQHNAFPVFFLSFVRHRAGKPARLKAFLAGFRHLIIQTLFVNHQFVFWLAPLRSSQIES